MVKLASAEGNVLAQARAVLTVADALATVPPSDRSKLARSRSGSHWLNLLKNAPIVPPAHKILTSAIARCYGLAPRCCAKKRSDWATASSVASALASTFCGLRLGESKLCVDPWYILICTLPPFSWLFATSAAQRL